MKKRIIISAVVFVLLMAMPIFAQNNEQDSSSLSQALDRSRSEERTLALRRIKDGNSFFSKFTLVDGKYFYNRLPWSEYNSNDRIDHVVGLLFEKEFFSSKEKEYSNLIKDLLNNLSDKEQQEAMHRYKGWHLL